MEGEVVVRLNWARDPEGYDLLDGEPQFTSKRELFSLKARSGREEPIVLGGYEHRVFESFVFEESTPEGMQRFSNRWGLIQQRVEFGEFNDEKILIYTHENYVMPVRVCLFCKKQLEIFLSLMREGKFKRATEVTPHNPFWHMSSRFDFSEGKGRPDLMFEANSLLSFMWFEAISATAKGDNLKACMNCGQIYYIGHRLGRNNKRIYCSDNCRLKFHRTNKSKMGH